LRPKNFASERAVSIRSPIKKQRETFAPSGGKRRLMKESDLVEYANTGRRRTRELVALGIFRPIRLGARTIRVDPDQVDESIRQLASGEIAVPPPKSQSTPETA
jgi:hypothetical protein